MRIIEFDDVSVRLDMIAVIARTKPDGDGYSYFIQTAFGKLTKYIGKTYDEVEAHRTALLHDVETL